MQNGLLLPCRLSEVFGGEAHIFFEKINKVVYIFITNPAAYFMDRQICGKQHFLCFSQPFICQVSERRKTVSVGKFPAEPVFADAETFFKLFKRERLFVMTFQMIPHFIEIIRDAFRSGRRASSLQRKKQFTENVIMLTIGTGVGGGIILDGKIYEGRRIGGSELGHMVIVENGEPCTCGRKGCLEAYASATALKKAAEKKLGKALEPREIFALAEKGEVTAREIADDFICKLGTGVVNITNIFRPQILLLGGRLTLYLYIRPVYLGE